MKKFIKYLNFKISDKDCLGCFLFFSVISFFYNITYFLVLSILYIVLILPLNCGYFIYSFVDVYYFIIKYFLIRVIICFWERTIKLSLVFVLHIKMSLPNLFVKIRIYNFTSFHFKLLMSGCTSFIYF